MASLLVIEDDPDMLSTLVDVLESAGYLVSGATSAAEALKLADQANPDLVISDVRMAGMDGIQCLEKLTESNPALKSIVITGYASQDVPGRAMDIDSSDYLCKPFSAAQLIQSVSRALAIPEEQAAPSYPPEMQQVGAALSHMDTLRRRAYQSFYLGVRSGHLNLAEALAVWDQLEAVEVNRLVLESQLRLRLEVAELTDGYLNISELCKCPPTGTAAKRTGMSRAAFQPFFKKIRDGQISSEQVRQAVRIRNRAREGHGEASLDDELYTLLWG
jgi:CheY-like chemotaxis protein